MRPWLLRPPDFESGRRSDFSGVDRVISAKSETLDPRRPGVVGLYLRMPISQLSPLRGGSAEDLDRLAFSRKSHDGALGVLALAEAGASPLTLALAVEGVDTDHLD